MCPTKQLTVEPHHPNVLVIFDRERPTSAAHAFMMKNFSLGNEQNFPVSLPSAHAPIKVFAVQEISLAKGNREVGRGGAGAALPSW